MSENSNMTTVSTSDGKCYNPRFIELHHISMIDEALESLGEYGEIRLIVERGRLRFLITQKSYDALKWHPGSITR